MKTIKFTLLIVYLLSSSMLFAEERTDFKVNDDKTTASQTAPTIAVALDGSFAISWVDRRDESNDIYIQRYSTDGLPLGNNLLVNDDLTSAYQSEPTLGVDQQGRYGVVWKDYRNGAYPFDPSVYFQRLDSNLSMMGSNSNLTVEQSNVTRETPAIALSGVGDGVVVWADYRNNEWDIYGQRISGTGSLIGGNFIVNDTSSGQQHSPQVAISEQGWFVITWYDNRNGNDDIFCQLYDANGLINGTNIPVSADTGIARQAFPDVTTDGSGNFTVVWVDWRNGNYPSNPDIYSRKFTSDGTPVTGEININTDNRNTAQREPAIASDRLGNVAIIWADSIDNSWDIAGQMIDVDGIIRDTNFIANDYIDSAQLSPDVAIDGRYRYVTWVDRRNGDYDIYASVSKYNNPSLAVSPATVQFAMREGESAPTPINVSVEHTGYNPLTFSADTDVSWLAVTLNQSVTPAEVTVNVTTDTLPEGIYFGTIQFVDATFMDSSATIMVRLDVYNPTMSLSHDTISLSVFEGVDDVVGETVVIQNDWLGDFSWTAVLSHPALSLSSTAGQSDDSITVGVNGATLTAGFTDAMVIFTTADGNGGPDTLVVRIECVNDRPYLMVIPDSIYIYTDNIDSYYSCISINNPGVGQLNWTASSAAAWLSIDNIEGNANEDICLSFSSSLGVGRYQADLVIRDSSAFNPEVIIPVTLDYFRTSTDSIIITGTNVESGQTGSVSIIGKFTNPITAVSIPLRLDSSFIRFDSMSAGFSYPQRATTHVVTGSLNRLDFHWSADTAFTGELHLGEIHFSAQPTTGSTNIDTLIGTGTSFMVLTDLAESYVPLFNSSEIIISAVTDVEELPQELLPLTFSLSQNYPNPFNLNTVIEYSIPVKSKVILEVFNILGQTVQQFEVGEQPPGWYQLSWDGRFKDGQVAPTGMYFYRLRTEETSIVKKMVLIK